MKAFRVDRRQCLAGLAAAACCAGAPALAEERAAVSTNLNAFSNRAHIFVRPEFKERLTRCFTEVLGAAGPMVLPVPGAAEPMLAFRFPGGGSLSVEFTHDALDEERARFGAWLEVRTPEPQKLAQKILAAGLPQIHYPATTTFYFRVPGGQVIGIMGTEPSATANELKKGQP